MGSVSAQPADQKKIDSLDKLLKLRTPDSTVIKVYEALGSEYSNTDLGLSIQNYRYAYNLQKSKNDQQGMANTLRKIGNTYFKNLIYEKAQDYYLQSAKICQEIGDKEGLAGCYNNLGNIYARQGDLSGSKSDYEQSINYHKKALQLRHELNDVDRITISLLNIGNAYKGLGLDDTALANYKLAFEHFSKIGDVNGITISRMNIADTYLSMAIKNKNFEYLGFAKKNFEEQFAYYGPIGDFNNKASVLISLGRIYHELKDEKKAIDFLQEGFDMASRLHKNDLMKDAAKYLAEFYGLQGNFKMAFEYSQLCDQLKDSLITEQKIANMSRMQVVYETVEKESQIKNLEKDNQISNLEIEKRNADISKQKTLIIFSGLTVVVLLLMAFLLFNRFKLKQKANVELSKAYDLVEKKNIQITDSITYAKRIQDSILPSEQMLNSIFPESFIFFLPRDIVSGDFYWFSEKAGKIFIAVADCTGHGVPGALMSMIGNTLLNEIVNEKGIYSPDEVLSHLDEGISIALRQGTSTQTSQEDGMDISFCVIDKKANTLSFAGANHSLYVFQNGEMNEIKGDIYSIGGMFGKIGKQFLANKISISPGTSVYMTTDGYYDQFGGEKNKKFMSGKFQELLKNIQRENMEQQKTIASRTFSDWKGETKQLDDVLVVGFRI